MSWGLCWGLSWGLYGDCMGTVGGCTSLGNGAHWVADGRDTTAKRERVQAGKQKRAALIRLRSCMSACARNRDFFVSTLLAEIGNGLVDAMPYV